MGRIFRLFSIAFSILVSALYAPIAAVFAAFIYQPTAHDSLTIDRLFEPVAVIPAMRSRFMAFVDNARSHLDFTAGHFDPGRMAA